MKSAGSAVIVLVAGALRLCAQSAACMPSWLAPYPGAGVQTRTASGLVEDTYDTSAAVADVVAHYGKLFAGAGVPFQPKAYGTTSVIQGATDTANLTIQIRKKDSGAAVRVTCTDRPNIPKVTEEDVRRGMAKYDQPVYPTPRAAMPALTWPDWLISCEGGALSVQKGVDRFKLDYLSAAFDTRQARADAQRFYADLLRTHGYPVRLESSSITPPERMVLVEGTHNFGDPGPRFVIRAEITPSGAGMHVELRITAHR